MRESAKENWKEPIASIVNRLFVVCGLIYLACIPLGKVHQDRKFETIDIVFITIVLIANSDIIQRIWKRQFVKDYARYVGVTHF